MTFAGTISDILGEPAKGARTGKFNCDDAVPEGFTTLADQLPAKVVKFARNARVVPAISIEAGVFR
jgi:hypothetical protein